MTDPGTIRIRSIEDLRTALESPDPMTCLFTLQAIAADPERALSYGQKDGTDVIDLVIAVARQGTATALGAGALLVLGRFRDPRVAPVILDAFATSDHDDSVTACAEFLQASATAEVRSAVTPWLFQDADETRARSHKLQRVAAHNRRRVIRAGHLERNHVANAHKVSRQAAARARMAKYFVGGKGIVRPNLKASSTATERKRAPDMSQSHQADPRPAMIEIPVRPA